ncbi:MAG: hypothetical protein ACPGU4_10270 [Flavobacteriales bacterium]
MIPTLESAIEGLGLLDFDFVSIEYPLEEEKKENKETEKEEKKEKELEEFDLLDYRYSVFLTQSLAFLQNVNIYQSHVDDVPSPPPDLFS